MNGKHAAMRAGYAESSAAVQACLILKDPRAQAYLKEVMEAGKFDTSMVVAKVFKTALAEADGKIIKGADTIAAADKIFKLTGSYKDKVEINGSFVPVLHIFAKEDE